VLLLASSDDEDNGRKRNSGGGGGGRYYSSGPSFSIDFATEFLWYWDPFWYRRKRERLATQRGGESMNFLEAIFSWVFGDGDPNVDFDKQRWQAVRCHTAPAAASLLPPLARAGASSALRNLPPSAHPASARCLIEGTSSAALGNPLSPPRLPAATAPPRPAPCAADWAVHRLPWRYRSG
jgi:hypothetical protein